VLTLDTILALPDTPEKTAALVAWVQGLYPAGAAPVLVGGAAVELFTGGAYVTGDLDFVGSTPTSVMKSLAAAGFDRRGRHFVHEVGQVFIEFPSEVLQPGEQAALLRVGELELVVISLEDALADRLAAWKHWRSIVDGVNAWLLFRAQRGALDRRRCRDRAAAVEAADALEALLAFQRRVGRRDTSAEEVERWAQRGL
jgi:hypothetical protein